MKHLSRVLFPLLALNIWVLSAQDCPVPYEEKNGLIIMEAENTTSPLDKWIRKTDNPGYSGSGHIEFTGNGSNGGPATSPLEYKFKVNQEGYYRLFIRARKRLDGAPSDKNNDGYVKMDGDFDAGPNAGNNHNDDAPESMLREPTKFFGGTATGWGIAQQLDAGGHSNKRNAIYKFKASKSYTLTMYGRSIKWNVDRIILRRDNVSNNVAFAADQETKCDGPVDPPNNCIPEIKFPGGRIAMSFDGNKHDPDDIGAMPFALAFAKAAGLQDKVAFVEYSNHFCSTDNGMNDKMNTSAKGAIDRLGYDSSILNNFYENKTATTNKFIAAINASSASNPLWIVAGGPMESCWRALNGAERSKLQYVSIISHSTWNEKHPEDKHNEESCGNNRHRWTDIKEFESDGLTVIDIRDQNVSNGDNDFNTPRNKWNWLRDSSDPDLRWLHSRDQFDDKFDPSDAGMTYWLITGGPNGGNAQGGPAEAKKLLENPCDSTSENQVPTISFKDINTQDGLSVEEGYTLELEAIANDSDGTIETVKLFIDNVLVRQENIAPYNWGHAGSPDPDEINNLTKGTYTFKAVTTDNQGATAEISFVLTVEESTLSITDIEKTSSIEVFPNPVNNGTLTIQRQSSGMAEVYLYNIEGRLVYSIETSTKTTRINDLYMTPGLYLLQIKSDNQTEKVMRIIFE